MSLAALKGGLGARARRWLPRRALRWLALRRAPRVANIEVTTACDLACPLCATHIAERRQRFLGADAVENVLAGGTRLRDVCFHVLGEPLLHPRLFEIVGRFAESGARTWFGTNGRTLGERVDEVLDSGLDTLSVAIDGTSAEGYARYRVGGDVGDVLAGVRALLAARAERGATRPYVRVQMIAFPHLASEFEAARAELEALGADEVMVKQPSLSVERGQFAHRAGEVRVERALARAEAFVAESVPEGGGRRTPLGGRWHRDEKLCPQLEKATVLSDGRVVACCMDSDGVTAFGSVVERSLAEVWRSEERAELLRRFQRGEIELCRFCDLG